MRKIIVIFLLFFTVLISGCSGKSAYELALENGFTGTVDDYLESLKGENSSITIIDIFNSLVEKGVYNDDQYLDFINDYINNNLCDETIRNNSLNSCVSIKVTFGTFFINTYVGSGFVYKLDEDGTAYIITNHHVLVNPNNSSEVSSNIKVYIYGYEYESYSYIATYIGSCSNNDVGVIKVQLDLNYKAKYVSEALIEENYYVGDNMYAIGNALGDGLTITSGIVSVESEEIYTGYNVRVFRFDASVNGGNSGGAIFNKYGKVIGIVDAKYIDEEVDGIAYGIPITIAANIANNIIENNSEPIFVNSNFTTKVYSSSSYFINNKFCIKEVIVIDEISVIHNMYQEGLRSGDQLLSFEINNVEYDINRYYSLSDVLLGCSVGDVLKINTYRTTQSQYSTYSMILE
ncbi:MAG: serine protease [bacterium]